MIRFLLSVINGQVDRPMRCLVAALLVGALPACAGPDVIGYRPNLAKEPTDKVEYEKDLSDCKYAVLHPPGNALYGFGLLGGVAVHATNQQKMHDDWLPFGGRVDACMENKKYKVSK